MPRAADTKLWTDADWTEHRADLRRHKRLADDLISLTVQRHGGIDGGAGGWFGIHLFEPGDRTIQVDADLSVADIEVLRALLALPSMRYDSIASFDWKPFEDLRARLIEEIRAQGKEPELAVEE